MGRVFGIALIVIGIWVGLEIMQNGTQGAFGGALGRMGIGSDSQQEPQQVQTVPQRAGTSVQRAHNEADERRERMMEEQ